jgi:hypothetical protein
MKDVTRKNPGRTGIADNGALMPLIVPSANTVRWVARRKANVVAAVHAGILSKPEACQRFGLSPEEFREWEHRYKADGVEGLRVSAHQCGPHALH